MPGEGDDDGHVGGEPERAQRRQVGGGGDPGPAGEVGVRGVGPVGEGGVGVGGRGVVVAEAAGRGGHGDGGGVCLLVGRKMRMLIKRGSGFNTKVFLFLSLRAF